MTRSPPSTWREIRIGVPKPGARAPRRRRVSSLVDQRREPGHIQDPGRDECEDRVTHQRAAVLADHVRRDQREEGPDHDEHAPRMRVQHQRERRREQDQVAAPPVHERLDESNCEEDPEQAHQLVHPRFLRVVRKPPVEREQRRGHHPRPPPEQRPARPHPGRDREEPEQHGQRVGGGLARAERPHPEVQQHVVERRVPVVSEDPRDRAHRVRRDTGRDRLVHPELSADKPRPQVGRDREQNHQRSAHSDPHGSPLEPARGAGVGDRWDPGRGSGDGRHQRSATLSRQLE